MIDKVQDVDQQYLDDINRIQSGYHKETKRIQQVAQDAQDRALRLRTQAIKEARKQLADRLAHAARDDSNVIDEW